MRDVLHNPTVDSAGAEPQDRRARDRQRFTHDGMMPPEGGNANKGPNPKEAPTGFDNPI